MTWQQCFLRRGAVISDSSVVVYQLLRKQLLAIGYAGMAGNFVIVNHAGIKRGLSVMRGIQSLLSVCDAGYTATPLCL